MSRARTGAAPPNPHEHCRGLDKNSRVMLAGNAAPLKFLVALPIFFWLELLFDR
jgi:hypothetical protein